MYMINGGFPGYWKRFMRRRVALCIVEYLYYNTDVHRPRSVPIVVAYTIYYSIIIIIMVIYYRIENRSIIDFFFPLLYYNAETPVYALNYWFSMQSLGRFMNAQFNE